MDITIKSVDTMKVVLNINFSNPLLVKEVAVEFQDLEKPVPRD